MENTVELAHPWCLGKTWTSGPASLPGSQRMHIPELCKLLMASCRGILHPIPWVLLILTFDSVWFLRRDFWSPHPMLILVLLPLPLCYIRYMELPLKGSRHGLGEVPPPAVLTKQRLNPNGLPTVTQASDAVLRGSGVSGT